MPKRQLRVVVGPAKGTEIALDAPFTIGSEQPGEGSLGADASLSAQHARIRQDDGRVLVEDLGSPEGTWVNGRRIEDVTELRPGDSVRVGTTVLVLDAEGESAAGAAGAIGSGPAAAGAAGAPGPVTASASTVTTASGTPPAVGRPPAAGAPAGSPPAGPPRRNERGENGFFGRVGRMVTRRPKVVLAVVAAFLVVAAVYGSGVTSALEQNEGGFEDPAAEAVRTNNRLAAAAGELPTPQLLVLLEDVDVDAASTRERVERLESVIRSEDVVTRTVSFYSTDNPAFVSRDRDSTYIAAFMRDVPEIEAEEAATRIDEEIGDEPGVLVGGGARTGGQLGEQVAADLGRAEAIAFPLLFALSLFVFRGVVAALLPLFVGMLTIFTTFLMLRLVNEAVELSQFALNLVIGLGLGLAIDYSLFIVSRYREELAGGGGDGAGSVASAKPKDPEAAEFRARQPEALRRTVHTAGRTIVFSAVTVAVALAALTIFPQPFLYSMGLGGAVTALSAMTVALIALPALLAVLGPRVNSLSPRRWQRAAERTARQEREGPWFRLSQAVMRRPLTVALVSGALLLALGAPALGLQFTGVDSSSVPSHLSSRQVADALRADFGADVSEVTVVVQAPAGAREQVEAYAADLRQLPGANERLAEPPRAVSDDLWEVSVTPDHRALDDRSLALVEEIRAQEAPFRVSVTGDTAGFLDQKESIGSHVPIAVLMLCATTAFVLFLMTGSLVLPLKSLLMNALSLAAAFGLLVLIFQEGNLEGPLGFESQGAIEISQPVLLFAVAFGLATDYAVFLLTRIKEAREAGHSERDSVAIGLERTGRIVTQAALLFCIAIGAFATSSVIFIKEVGVGTALAVIIDATIIRAFLVPSLMALLGARNWWAPGPLRRLHRKIGLSEA